MLEEGVRDHRHERMTVKALPGSSLEVIETEFFFQLLVSLLANRNSFSREIVAHEVIECARLEFDVESICEMVVKELTGPMTAA
jgi:hypothetical protein